MTAKQTNDAVTTAQMELVDEVSFSNATDAYTYPPYDPYDPAYEDDYEDRY